MLSSDNARGAAAMMAAMAGFSLNDAMMKIVFETMPVGQGMFFRGLVSSAVGFALVLWAVGRPRLRGVTHPVVLLRSLFDVIAAFCFLTALASISLATLTATLQVTPLIATALAALLLKEPVGWRRWLATAVGLGGVMIVIAPWEPSPANGGESMAQMALLGLAAAFFAAARDLSTRAAPRETSMFVIALAIMIGNTLAGGLVGALSETWRPLTGADVGLLGVAAVFVMVSHVLVGVAMRIGEVSAISPFRYVIVLWAMLWSWSLFAEPPSALDLVGVTIVIGAGLYTLRRERVRGGDAASAAGYRGAAPKVGGGDR